MKRRTPLGEIGNTLYHDAASTAKDKTVEKLAAVHKPTPLTALVSARASLSPRVDEKNRSNALCAVDYVKEIHEHFHKTEGKYRASATYMGRQNDINEKMRSILVDWLVDVHLKFKLLPETLYLAVDIIDRFLDQKVVSRSKLQLVGVVSMLLAAKYEEIYPPEIKDFIYISANTYTREEILRMERLTLQTLDFQITTPSIYAFLRRGLQVVDADKTTSLMAQYLAELCILDYNMLVYLPSTIAAACIYCANKFLAARDPWNPTLQHYTHYKIPNFERCARDIAEIVRNAPTQKTQAVRKKYSYPKYCEVSKLTRIDIDIP